jgi:hypothetical protein
MKESWRDHLTTVFPRQGHYAMDAKTVAAFPAADITIERIGALIDYDSHALIDNPMRQS